MTADEIRLADGKIRAEIAKLSAEVGRINREYAKLEADPRKTKRETTQVLVNMVLAPVIAGAALMGASVALVKLFLG